MASYLMEYTITENLHEDYRPFKNCFLCIGSTAIAIVETITSARLLILSLIFSKNKFHFKHHVELEKDILSSSSFTVIWSIACAILGFRYSEELLEDENEVKKLIKGYFSPKNKHIEEDEGEEGESSTSGRCSYDNSFSYDLVNYLKEIRRDETFRASNTDEFLASDFVYPIAMILATIETFIEIIGGYFWKSISSLYLKLDEDDGDFKYLHKINVKKLESSKETISKIFKEFHKKEEKAPLDKQYQSQQKIPKDNSVYN
jgi:hypothetical protein